MVQYAATNVSGTLVSAGGYPALHLGAKFDGTTFTFRTLADFWNASGPELTLISGQTITNIYDGAGLVVAPEFFGATWHNWPNNTASLINVSDDGVLLNDAGVLFKSARSHDYQPISGGSTRWHHLEPSKGAFTWTNLDKFVNDHYNAGRDVVYTLGFTPSWATSAADAGSNYAAKASNPPDNITDWTDYCSAVATRYAGKIKAYEVWNEPNASTAWWNGTHAQYVALLKAANQTIKAIDPAAKIVGAITTSWGGGVGSSGYTWTNTMLGTSDGATGTGKDWLDVLGVHLYATTPYTGILTMIDAVTSLKATHGISAKETWDTESGLISPYATNEKDDTIAAQFVRNMLVRAAKGVSRVFWYDMDGSNMGYLMEWPTARAVALWNDVRSWLLAGSITRINFLWDGRVAFTRSGVNYLV